MQAVNYLLLKCAAHLQNLHQAILLIAPYHRFAHCDHLTILLADDYALLDERGIFCLEFHPSNNDKDW